VQFGETAEQMVMKQFIMKCNGALRLDQHTLAVIRFARKHRHCFAQ